MAQQSDARFSTWEKPLRILAATFTAALGIALIVVPLSTQQTTVCIGIGLIIVGFTLVLEPGQHDPDVHSVGSFILTRFGRAVGAAMVAFGLLLTFWPDAGAPWLAAMVALSLILHGIASAILTFRGDADNRVAGLLIALAGIALGFLAFSWPVLTIAIFKLAVGAWFIFTGLRALFLLWRNQRSERAATTNTSLSRVSRWARTIGAALALVLAVGASWGSAQILGGTPLPTPDDFYLAPDQLPTSPGQLIRTEPLSTGVPSGAQAWKMLYTTTLPDGSAGVSSGTILAPANRDGQELPLLTVSHGTTGVIDGCAPSLSATPFADGAGTAMQQMVTEHGWVAVTSDYSGMGTTGTAAYLVGEAEARNVLDASRAARQFEELSISSATVIWGHSQGGQGSLWTAQRSADYAPELTILGTAAFAPAADLYGLADADKNNAAGKTVSAYIAYTWNQLYPELNLEAQLTPGSQGPVQRISQLCFNGSDAIAAILRGTQVPNQIFPDSMLAGDFGKKLKDQTPVGPFPAPVLVAQGLADPLVLPSMQQKWVNERCDAGEVIDYRTFEGLSHVSLVAADSPLTPQIVEWTLDRWRGDPAAKQCSSKSYPSTKSTGAEQ
ncbi:lipase family protein [Leucobacter sp. UT-8R-CII-1-4]|uniref:lipase family protein n=1 Tax=Leucobacter sp. UT-8R-CII-1-4 TaxID=3040075 RepID=UPI0024A8C74A|nr:lipase family protein [Leucobacter sp. UT-8R-CII-1-4]MDI6022013.1 lipase family protein [Leucobacter sp. UT-8R-CII-1-4]